MPIDDIIKKAEAERAKNDALRQTTLEARQVPARARMENLMKWSESVLLPILTKAETQFGENGYAAKISKQDLRDPVLGIGYYSGYTMQFAALRGAALAPSIAFGWDSREESVSITTWPNPQLDKTVKQVSLAHLSANDVQREVDTFVESMLPRT
jgi:hypothetical protein